MEKITPTQNNNEKGDRKSLGFFIHLRKKIFDEIGMPNINEFSQEYEMLSYYITNLNTISEHLNSRNEVEQTQKIKDYIKDIFRSKNEWLSDAYVIPKESLEKTNLSGINSIKKDLLKKISKYEKVKPSMDSLIDVEYGQYVGDILKKYNKTKISELLEVNCVINYDELSNIIFDVKSSLEYRNRKINEFIAYKYARAASCNDEVNEFIKNTHTILLSTHPDRNNNAQNDFRTESLKSNLGFFAPFPPQLIENSMKNFESHIHNLDKSNDFEKNQREALKNYILFEIIHPFRDGNGRTGRALFVYIQRYLVKEQNIRNPIIHIPISRFESETYSSENRYHSALGSLPKDLSSLLKKIMIKKEIIDICEKTLYKDKSEIKEFSKNIIEQLRNVIGSEEMKPLIDELLTTIKKQSLLDDVKSNDLNMVYESVKNNLSNS